MKRRDFLKGLAAAPAVPAVAVVEAPELPVEPKEILFTSTAPVNIEFQQKLLRAAKEEVEAHGGSFSGKWRRIKCD